MADLIPVYRLKKIQNLPALSADINAAPWRDLPEFGALHLLGTPGDLPQHKTVIKACWDDSAIRILWHCEDDAIRATYTNRDDPLWSEEVVEVFLCPGRNLTDYYEFNFNPLGAVFDAHISNPTIVRDETFKPDIAWNCEGLTWKVIGEGKFNGSAAQDKWWAVEANIPFASLGGARTPKHGEYWHANVFRIETTDPVQYCSWSVLPIFKPGFHRADQFGSWVFVE
jgi:hypothetical protein